MNDTPAPVRVRSDKPPAPSTSPMADRKPPAPEPEKSPPDRTRVRNNFGMRQNKLAWPAIPGFHLHWFMDMPGRIDYCKTCGYEHVLNEKGQPVSMTHGVREFGGGLTGYLMKIPQEFYEEDFALKQEGVDAIDEAIYRGRVNEDAGDKRYVPKDSIKIGVTRGRTG